MAEEWTVVRLPGDDEAWQVLDADGRPVTRRPVLTVTDERGQVWAWVDGRTVRVSPRAEADRPRQGPAPHDTLASPMPATVVRVEVQPGDEVEAGQTLVLVEAMKMEVPLRAPHRGHVTAVSCAPGELVQPGTPLVEIEEVS